MNELTNEQNRAPDHDPAVESSNGQESERTTRPTPPAEMTCWQCGSPMLREGRCWICMACGYSKCG